MTQPLKVLLLENIHPLSQKIFENEGFVVETLPKALSPEELVKKIKGVHILGIRSKTQITAEVIGAADQLITLGAFCIGTNQIDLKSAKQRGIAVFNAPFGNTRSVAEMMVAEIIMLSRQLGDRNREMHRGVWNKTHKSCHEVRGKKLGIIGYGNIGTQLSTLAESLGMQVIFYDILPKLPRGNANKCSTLNSLLEASDIVTLHVPATPLTHRMMGEEQFKRMKKGAFLMNASRGTVVDLEALAAAMKSGHIAGAAVDVYPEEPESNIENYKNCIQNLPNMILTPHIGGATEEAQTQIGEEVPTALIRYVRHGSTTGSVNFPEVALPPTENTHRILNVHKNVPGVLREINQIISDLGANIEAEMLSTDPEVGYLILDTNREFSHEVSTAIRGLKTSIMTRVLY